ncbi:MAG TPA: hypothetical protein VFZ78_03065 [Flavisolibacter sp.]
MKNRKRAQRILNFLAFNILFFALYLNFIHKDSNVAVPSTPTVSTPGTVLVTNPDQYIKKQTHSTGTAQTRAL